MKKILLVLVVLAIFLLGCEQAVESDLIQCEEQEEGLLCYALYDPVCGLTASGEWKTFSNDCVACVNGAIGYKQGECEVK